MLKLTFACHDYDHVRDIFEPEVVTEGVELTQLKLPVEEIFFRFIKFGEFEVSEHSFAKYVSLRSKGQARGGRYPGVSVSSLSPLCHLRPERLGHKNPKGFGGPPGRYP